MRALLDDPRDAPQARLVLSCSVVLLAAAGVFLAARFTWWLAAGYWLIWGIFFDRVNTMIHRFSHHPIFKRRYQVLNGWVTWVIAPVFGQSPASFYVHHVGMHHPEDNLPGDLSSTMRFQRDDALDFARYTLRFFLVGIPELALYHWRRKHARLALRLVAGELAYLALWVGLGVWRLPATLVVLVVPYAFTTFIQLAGNWGQHAFVDPDAPDDDYKSSVTIIWDRYNRRCFDDGYHTFHHLRPAVHHGDLKAEFEENRETYGRRDALVFDGINQIGIWLLLLTHRHRALARHVVRLPGAPERGEDEMVALLRRRLAPIRSWAPAGAAA